MNESEGGFFTEDYFDESELRRLFEQVIGKRPGGDAVFRAFLKDELPGIQRKYGRLPRDQQEKILKRAIRRKIKRNDDPPFRDRQFAESGGDLGPDGVGDHRVEKFRAQADVREADEEIVLAMYDVLPLRDRIILECYLYCWKKDQDKPDLSEVVLLIERTTTLGLVTENAVRSSVTRSANRMLPEFEKRGILRVNKTFGKTITFADTRIWECYDEFRAVNGTTRGVVAYILKKLEQEFQLTKRDVRNSLRHRRKFHRRKRNGNSDDPPTPTDPSP